MILPLEKSWKHTVNRKLTDYYGIPLSPNSDLIEGIDRFNESEFRLRMHEAIGHRFVRELQYRLTVHPETQRISRAEWRKFLNVSESTLSRWNRDLNLAGGQYFFVFHVLRLNLPLGAIAFPEPAIMLSESIVSFIRHVRYKYLQIDKNQILTSTTVNHLMNLMHLMEHNETFVYNPEGDDTQKANKNGLRSYAKQLYQSRFSGQNLSHDDQLEEIEKLTNEVKSWLDDWGLAYALLAVGYSKDWVSIVRDK
jgi:hypothetical protein